MAIVIVIVVVVVIVIVIITDKVVIIAVRKVELQGAMKRRGGPFGTC